MNVNPLLSGLLEKLIKNTWFTMKFTNQVKNFFKKGAGEQDGSCTENLIATLAWDLILGFRLKALPIKLLRIATDSAVFPYLNEINHILLVQIVQHK